MEKGKLLTLAMALFTLVTPATKAQGNIVELHEAENKEDITKGHRTDIPIVTYDGNCVTIFSDFSEDVTVLIKDEAGLITYQVHTPVSPAGTIVSIPESDEHDKYIIELIDKKKKFYGYLEE